MYLYGDDDFLGTNVEPCQWQLGGCGLWFLSWDDAFKEEKDEWEEDEWEGVAFIILRAFIGGSSANSSSSSEVSISVMSMSSLSF